MKKHIIKSTKSRKEKNRKGGAKAPSLLFKSKDTVYKIIGLITLLLFFLIGLYLIHQDLEQTSSLTKIINAEKENEHGQARR